MLSEFNIIKGLSRVTFNSNSKRQKTNDLTAYLQYEWKEMVDGWRLQLLLL